MAAQSRLLFTNLPVADLEASKAFFGALGFTFDPKFSNGECACMVISEQAYVMLLVRGSFAGFTPKPVADASRSTEVLLCVSAESREAVDALADAALAAGGTYVRDAQDHGFMYGRSFDDPDGHVWEVMWMSQEAVEAGPADMAHSA